MEHVNRKRVRDESSYDSSVFDSPHVKRLRDDLLDILVDSDPEPTVHDLTSIMKSFEEEICGGSPSRKVTVVDLTSDSGESQPELGYLLEASDDELGLPPTTKSSAGDEGKIVETEFVHVSTESAVGFGVDLWGFEDGIPSFDSLEYGVGGGGDNGINNGEYVALDGLFDFPDVYFGSSDFPWRSETLPAL